MEAKQPSASSAVRKIWAAFGRLFFFVANSSRCKHCGRPPVEKRKGWGSLSWGNAKMGQPPGKLFISPGNSSKKVSGLTHLVSVLPLA